MFKAAPGVDAEGRSRMCQLALALPLLCQGVPFTHAGDDLLRSKSLDRDSYNSGDWCANSSVQQRIFCCAFQQLGRLVRNQRRCHYHLCITFNCSRMMRTQCIRRDGFDAAEATCL